MGAGITVGNAGCKEAFAALLLDAGIPALLRTGASEALSGQLDFARDVLTLRNRGVGTPLEVNEMGRCLLSVVAFGDGSRDREGARDWFRVLRVGLCRRAPGSIQWWFAFTTF